MVVNAGNANACTGKQGSPMRRACGCSPPTRLRLPVEQVAVASTGLIGVQLPMEKIEPGIDAAARPLAPAAARDFAAAIRTTDRPPRRGALDVRLPEGVVRLGFAAKGCGMISPNMATMLCFVTCDAVARQPTGPSPARAVACSFNRITVDGQESTNDMVARALQRRLRRETGRGRPGAAGRGAEAALLALAVAIVADGEGTTRTMRLTVTGASDHGEAEAVARAVANSPLVKTAFYGRDANWGRIVQAIGQALGPRRRSACRRGSPTRKSSSSSRQPVALDAVRQDRLAAIMDQPEIDLKVALNGPGGGRRSTSAI